MHALRRRLAGLALALPLALALALAAGPALGWNHAGHQAAAGIADQLIAGSPAAARVRQLLGADLQSVAAWADCARAVSSTPAGWRYLGAGSQPACAAFETPAGQAALVDFVQRNAERCDSLALALQCRHKTYHYTDISIAQHHYDPALPGARPDDLVQALGAAIATLQGRAAAAPFHFANAQEALRLLVHYVGDLHQPLHVGSVYLSDSGQPLDPATRQAAAAHDNAGGNRLLLDGRNLHGIWDDIAGTTSRTLLAGPGAALARRVPVTAGAVAHWPVAWADDTLATARQVFQQLKFQPRSGDSWPASDTTDGSTRSADESRETVQRAQLIKAGARLAQVLMAIWP